MALLGLAFGIALCTIGWFQVNELSESGIIATLSNDELTNLCYRTGIGAVNMDGPEKVGLYFISISFTLLAVISLMG